MSDQSTKPVEYRDVKDFPGYQIGSDGSVWTLMHQIGFGDGGGSYYIIGNQRKRMSTSRCYGYVIVSLRRGGKAISKRVHRLVLEAFVGPCPDGMQGCHFPDRNKENNSVGNLRWDTPSANQLDRIAHGTDLRGEDNPFSKLTEALVRKAFDLRRSGMTHKKIAEAVGVKRPTITDLFKGATWKHLGLSVNMPTPS